MVPPPTRPDPPRSEQSPKPRRTGRALAIAIALAIIAVVAAVVVRDATESTNTSEISEGLAPQPERRFIRVGTENGEQFTDEEFSYLADNFDVVLLTKYHDDWNIRGSHDAATRLVDLDPSIKVMPYFNALYWFEDNNWGTQPDPRWFLRDASGDVIHRTTQERGEQEAVDVVDLSNPAYRDWAIGVMRSWLAAAPYAGISFDEARPIVDLTETQDALSANVSAALGPQRAQAYNDGLRDLLARAQELVGPDREVIYNGILPSANRADRNLGLLAVADGVLAERFCLNRNGAVSDIQADLDLMAEQTDKKLYLRTNYLDSFDSKKFPQFSRLCFGAFMLGWQPGKDFYQLGADYSADQLANDPQVLSLDLGEPTDPYRVEGGVSVRDFTNGRVMVNLGNRPTTATVPNAGTSLAGSKGTTQVEVGDEITVPARDAVFILYSV